MAMRTRLNICQECDNRDWFDSKEFYNHSCTKCGCPVGERPDKNARAVSDGWPGGVHRGLGVYLPEGTTKREMRNIAGKKGLTIEFDGRLISKHPQGRKHNLKRELHKKYNTRTYQAYMSKYGGI